MNWEEGEERARNLRLCSAIRISKLITCDIIKKVVEIHREMEELQAVAA